MKAIRTGAAALVVASMLSATPLPGGASAQTAAPRTAASSGFDGLWLLAVGTGVVAGVVVATVVTDGVIIPAYMWAAGEGGMLAGMGGGAATGGRGAMAAGARAGMRGAAAGEGAAMAAGGRAAGTAAAGEAGAMAAGGRGAMAAPTAAAPTAAAGNMAQNGGMWGDGTMWFRRGMQLLGAVTGGTIADGLYGG